MSSDEEGLLRDTTKEERRILCSVVRKTGSKISGLLFVSGVLVLVFGAYLLSTIPDPAMSVRLSIIFTGALGSIGALNIMSGLLLLLGEEPVCLANGAKHVSENHARYPKLAERSTCIILPGLTHDVKNCARGNSGSERDIKENETSTT